MLYLDILMQLKQKSSIGYLDIDGVRCYDVESQEEYRQSILYVKDKKRNKFVGYIVVFEDDDKAKLQQFCECDELVTMGKIIIADNIEKLFKRFTNQL